MRGPRGRRESAGHDRLSDEQEHRLRADHGLTSDLALVVGYAGTGKSAMLGVAREAWEAVGLAGARCGPVGDRGGERWRRGSGIGVADDRQSGARVGAGEGSSCPPGTCW